MKTSEFINNLKDMGYDVSVENDIITVADFGDWFKIGDIHKESIYLSLHPHKCFRNTHNVVLSQVYKYLNTPAEERKEETKFYLRLPEPFGGYKNYVNLVDGKFSIDNKEHSTNFKTEFTKEEIDAMPFNTKFFIKEEVK